MHFFHLHLRFFYAIAAKRENLSSWPMNIFTDESHPGEAVVFSYIPMVHVKSRDLVVQHEGILPGKAVFLLQQRPLTCHVCFKPIKTEALTHQWGPRSVNDEGIFLYILQDLLDKSWWHVPFHNLVLCGLYGLPPHLKTSDRGVNI